MPVAEHEIGVSGVCAAEGHIVAEVGSHRNMDAVDRILGAKDHTANRHGAEGVSYERGTTVVPCGVHPTYVHVSRTCPPTIRRWMNAFPYRQRAAGAVSNVGDGCEAIGVE